MGIQAVQVTVTHGTTPVPVADSDGDPTWGDDLAFRNTGTVDLYIGGSTSGTCNFPLLQGETIGMSVAQNDILYAMVQSGSVDGQISAIKSS